LPSWRLLGRFDVFDTKKKYFETKHQKSNQRFQFFVTPKGDSAEEEQKREERRKMRRRENPKFVFRFCFPGV